MPVTVNTTLSSSPEKHRNDAHPTNAISMTKNVHVSSSPKSKKDKKSFEKMEEKNVVKSPVKHSEYKKVNTPVLVSNYVPVEMPLRPDWFDMKPPLESDLRPNSIIDGVLYTSGSLLESNQKSKPLAFNLILPEIFETYDVCKQHPKLIKRSGSEKFKDSDTKELKLSEIPTRDKCEDVNSFKIQENVRESLGKV